MDLPGLRAVGRKCLLLEPLVFGIFVSAALMTSQCIMNGSKKESEVGIRAGVWNRESQS